MDAATVRIRSYAREATAKSVVVLVTRINARVVLANNEPYAMTFECSTFSHVFSSVFNKHRAEGSIKWVRGEAIFEIPRG